MRPPAAPLFATFGIRATHKYRSILARTAKGRHDN